jgi:predicted amidohydrolase YtcJ
MRLLVSFFFIVIMFISCSSSTTVDTVVHHGIIYTVDDKFTIAEALAVKDGKIVAVGTNNEILKQYEAKESIDAKGKAVYPGFIDAHAHFLGYGQSLFMVDLFGTTSWDKVVARVQKFAKEHPEEKWIKGRGWDQNKWPGKSYPTNAKLNELFAGTPVILTRVDGHAAIVNQKAIDLAGIAPGQKLVGGEIETKNGKLTGVLIDNAVTCFRANACKYDR